MTLKNAFEDLALDSSVQAINTTLQGGINVDTGLVQPLTDAELRASALNVNLPTGAATSANQTTANNSLSSIDTKLPSLDGGYVPVTLKNSAVEITNDSGNAIPVNGTITANIGTTNGVALDSSVNSLLKPADTLAAVTAVGTITNTVTVKADTTSNQTYAFKVDGSATTQPVSFTRLSSSTDSVTTVPSGTQTVSGTVTANAGSGTFAVSAASLPLPTGAATSANQTTTNNSLSSIDGKVPALGQALAAGSVPIVLTSAQLTTLTPPAAITGYATEATLADANTKLPIGLTVLSNRLLTDGSGVTQPVSFTRLSSSTDSITTVPSGTQTVSGTVTANAGTGTFAVSAASLPLPSGAATSALQTTGNNSLSSIDGKTPALVQGTSPMLVYGISEGGGVVAPISVSDEGHLEVALQSPASVFGEVIVGGLHSLAQGDFAYGLNSNVVSSSVTGSGTATSSNQMAVCSTTATTSSSATIRSVRTAKYRAGQGINARFTAQFTTGVANSAQYAGLFNAQDGYSFGYNGTQFGVLYRRNNVDTWTAQSSFNLDKLDGTGKSGLTIDPTKINIFRMQVGYLGVFGCVFSVLSPINGQWVECHRTTTANTATTPQFINPTMWFSISSVNTTNNTNIVVRSASFGVFLEGERKRLGGIYGTQNFKSISTTATNVLTVRCNTTINGVTNNSIIRIRSLSVATAANVPVVFQAIKNTTLGGTPAYTNVDATNSMAAIDTAGTTVTGGTIVFNTLTGSAGNAFCDLTDFDIQLQPGETLTITANSISGAASNQAVAINWSEDT